MAHKVKMTREQERMFRANERLTNQQTKVVETPQQEFERIRAEHERDFVDVQVELTDWERQQAPYGVTTRTVSVPRKKYEDEQGISTYKATKVQYDRTLGELWRRPYDQIQYLDSEVLFDQENNLPRAEAPIPPTPANNTLVENAYNVFIDSMGSTSVLSSEGKRKLLLYAASQQIEDRRIILTSLLAWQTMLNRLASLGALDDDYASIPEEKIEQPKLSVREEAEAEWHRLLLFPQWVEQVRRDYGIRLDDRVKRIVCDEFVRMNLSPHVHESYNIIRRALVARQIFPKASNGLPALTVDERMAELTERYDFNDSSQRREWASEMGRLRAALPLPEPPPIEGE
jgi:hypothetical protein